MQRFFLSISCCHKNSDLPYGWWTRGEFAKELHAAYTELTNDLGGADSLSHIKRVLAKKFCWLSAILRGIELQIADGNTKDSAELLGKWISTTFGEWIDASC